ncbi:ABC transporter permease [Microbacterium sp. OR21]|uniref:ABC transporter permease n=1 Tax=Microbacterium sp. OR21 TaxID=3095346 RepID=UPI0039B6D6B0
MSVARILTIARLELTQRLRSVGWYVLLGIFAVLLLGITALSFLVYSGSDLPGAGVFSIIVNFVLLLVVLVSPTLSGNAINGDREAATLAPVQVTAATTGDIMLGKLLAAVVTGCAFLLIAVPFLVAGIFGGGMTPGMFFVSLLVLLLEIVVVAAMGVGLSGLIARPLFSIAATYLVVAALVVGTLIAFGLGGSAIRTEVTHYERGWDESGEPICDEWQEYTYEQPRFDYVWGFLAANPFVVMADGVRRRLPAGHVRPDQVRRAHGAAAAGRAAVGRLRRRIRCAADAGGADPRHGAELVRGSRHPAGDRRRAVRRRVVAHPHAGASAATGNPHRLIVIAGPPRLSGLGAPAVLRSTRG